MHPLHSLLVKDIAADPVNSISGIANDRPMPKGLNDLIYQAGLRILRINAKHKSLELVALIEFHKFTCFGERSHSPNKLINHDKLNKVFQFFAKIS